MSEIWQQPELWRETARRITAARETWQPLLSQSKAIVLTGSGSSYFAGKCVAPALQAGTGLPVTAIESGELLVMGRDVLPSHRPLLLISLARSGDSPESVGLIQQLLEDEAGVHHLVITCNPEGALAHTWGAGQNARVRVLLLDERTCDKSLVMTSSFTSMAVAALALGSTPLAERRYLAAVEALASSVEDWLRDGLAPLDEFAIEDPDRLLAIGNGATQGAASEVALKMLEMTAGRVLSRADGCLGLRHGPMCGLTGRSLLFLTLSSHPVREAYQIDVLREIREKGLAGSKVVVGAQVPTELLGRRDLAIRFPALAGLGDEWIAIASVVVGQLLAFLRCRAEGLQPDQPVEGDAISRVVGGFTLHSLGAGVL